MAFFLGTQFVPTSVIRKSVFSSDQTMTPAITGNPWDGSSGGLATSDGSSDGTHVTPVRNWVPPVAQSNPPATPAGVTGTLGNLLNTIIQDVTGFVPWIVLAVIVYFGYRLFKPHR